MKTIRPIFANLLAFWMVFSAAVLARGEWKTGVAKVNITPEKQMWMSGYSSRDRAAEGKLADLWAKALVLEDGQGQRGVLVSLDLIGIDRQLSQLVCNALREEYGFSREQVALCFSHTHTGPVVGRNLAPLHYLTVDKQQQAFIDQYATTLVNRIREVVGLALEDLGPSQLAWGNGVCTFAVNRRNNPASEAPARRTAASLIGPFDHDVPVLAVRGEQGKLETVVFGYACHSTVLSAYEWSGDYPGFAQAALEANNPGCVAMFWAGCGADQNPLPRSSVELARHYGRRLATAVETVLLTSEMAPVKDRLVTRYREINLALDRLPTREEIERDVQSDNKYIASRARMLIAQYDRDGGLSQTYPYPIGVWQLGDEVQFVILGGEVVVDFALRLKVELAGKKTWVAGYSNDVMAYIPSRRVLHEGGYEGAIAMIYYGLPTVWSPEVENEIVQEVHAQLTAPE
ncbi:MAG: neutral/alkaline non-lysosomal ceramidase N-terminal domain-containing protein [Pirellulaceae bacterium]